MISRNDYFCSMIFFFTDKNPLEKLDDVTFVGALHLENRICRSGHLCSTSVRLYHPGLSQNLPLKHLRLLLFGYCTLQTAETVEGTFLISNSWINRGLREGLASPQ